MDAWIKEENTSQRKITWSDIWKADFHCIRFLVQVVYDVLPNPANSHLWDIGHPLFRKGNPRISPQQLPKSLWRCKVFTQLGIIGEAKRKAIRAATEAAGKATRWLWVKRADPWLNAAGDRLELDQFA